jgi:hypothetical protein
MPESAFLDTVAAFLSGPAGLAPAPAVVGVAAPLAAAELPAIALSLPAVERISGGAAGVGEPVRGALQAEAVIDLASPFLPDLPGFSLVSADRLGVVLPHGGLVRADGTEGTLGPGDVEVRVGGVLRPLAAPPPAGNQVSVDAEAGRLEFATALPPTGTLRARYVIGEWSRVTTMLSGQLGLTTYGATAAAAAQLSVAATRALLAANLPGLRKLALDSLGAIGAGDAALAGSRARAAVFRFQYEHVVDDPSSAGGIIRRIPLTTALQARRFDRASGLELQEEIIETG